VPPVKTLFLHIPKTAGVSLRETVRRAYPGGRCIFVYSHEPEQLEAVRKNVQRAEAVYGHFYFGFHEFLGVEARYVTMLRDPIDRVVSFFRHQARHDDNEYHRLIADGMTLLDLLRSEQCHQVNNHMVRILSGHPDSAITGDVGLLHRAEANLEAHFDAVGITERVEESVELIGRRLGWRKRSRVAHLNVDPERRSFSLDAETRAEVQRYNALDIELYDEAVRRFGFEVPAG
jgi:hypothetical protein